MKRSASKPGLSWADHTGLGNFRTDKLIIELIEEIHVRNVSSSVENISRVNATNE